jgi:hypothetical protein
MIDVLKFTATATSAFLPYSDSDASCDAIASREPQWRGLKLVGPSGRTTKSLCRSRSGCQQRPQARHTAVPAIQRIPVPAGMGRAYSHGSPVTTPLPLHDAFHQTPPLARHDIQNRSSLSLQKQRYGMRVPPYCPRYLVHAVRSWSDRRHREEFRVMATTVSTILS